MRYLIATLGILGLLAAVGQTALAAQAGDQCAVMWGGSWYLATIVSAVDDNYTVAYADGDKKSGVRNTEIRHLPKDPEFEVGDTVMAVWSSARFYQGKVVEIGKGKWMVAWDDGSAPSWVERGQIARSWLR